ncbi:uncharacterized protein G2W53_002060 [Senna tora]|uniref:Uncharacterized protein n=1 Tax=Senna tora TaxID=362788 RepID=A0A834XGN0_9FABA|nr:uncharacterized protein G2W53_002060 [Senna tora]
MPKFTLYHDYEFLMYSYDLRYTNTILVMKANEGHRGNIKLHFSPIASIHHREGQADFNELEIYGVVISGHHLQQLTQQLLDRAILVNHQGLCLTKLREAHEVYIPLHDIFNWSNYGVTDVPYPPRDSWSGSSSVVTVFRDPSCSSAWGPDRRYLDEVETVTEFVFPPPKEIIICSRCDEYEVQVKELEERLEQKQQELEDCRETLEKKEEEISCYQRHLEEKDGEVKDLELELEKVNTRLCAKQSKAINALQTALDSLINPEEC